MTQAELPTQDDPRWHSVMKRIDGRFVYAVHTTGIYCRASCPSRRANPAHVVFYDTPAQARAAGFRPSLRCSPDGPARDTAQAVRITAACRRIEAAETLPSLADLARAAGLSPSHFHRRFKAVTGLTPRGWGAAHRAHRLRAGLTPAGSVTEAIYEAGFASGSRFYEQADAMLGMTPGAYRAGGRDMAIRFAVGQCTLGAILVAESARGICAITLGDDPALLVHALQDRFPQADLIGGDAGFEARVAQVVGVVEAPGIGLDLPLDLQGTAFQERVWQALRQVPPGQTVSYAELAARIDAPGAARAVAQACAANRLAVAIPCHRVIRTDGGVSGYRWGVARKRALLMREKQP